MVLLAAALVLATVGLLVYGVLSVLTTPREQVRYLPRAVWLLLVVALPLVGGAAWLVLGRPSGPVPPPRPARGRPAPPDDDAAFLRQLRERADGQRAEAERRRREAAERRDADRPGPGGDPRPEPPPA